MERTAIYLRISSDVAGLGLGVARQREDCAELCRRRGWGDVAEYVDNDVSAFSGKERAAYRRLLDDVRAGRVRRIVAWHPDRLHRSPVELEEFVAVVEATGCAVETVQSGAVDLSTPSGRLNARVIGSFARYESEHKSDRVRRKMLQNAQDGKAHGGRRPYGWQADRVHLDPAETAWVRLALDLVLAGNSVKAVCRRLNEEGSRNTAGGLWVDSTLRPVLLRERNAGLRRHQGEVVEGVVGQWEPLCTVEEWQRVRAILRDPSRVTTPGRRGRVHLLSGLALCGVCGGPMRVCKGKAYKAVAATIYRCHTGSCVSRGQESLDGFVRALVVARLSRPDAVDLLAPPAEDGAEARAEVERLRTRLDTLAADYGDDLLTRDQFVTATERTRARLAQAERLLPAPTPQTSALTSLVGQPHVGAAWDALDVSVRRRVVEVLLDVAVLPVARRGRGFDPASVRVGWRE